MKKELQSKDLRIGNVIKTFVNTTVGKLYEITTVQALHMNTVEIKNGYTFQYNMIDGVLFDEDILTRLGFEKYNDCFYSIQIGSKKIDGWFLSTENKLTKSIDEFIVRCEYVHELQNLCFAWCSKELELKDKLNP